MNYLQDKIKVLSANEFDTLSNLSIETNKMNGDNKPLNELIAHLVNQLGYEKYWGIVESSEYMALYEANVALFDGVEKVRHGAGMGAKDFDDLNQARHRAKQALQRRFWGSELTEMKT